MLAFGRDGCADVTRRYTRRSSAVARYEPQSEDETFNIMNVLDPVLRTSNSGVVLAAVKAFVRLTEPLPELHEQVYERLKAVLAARARRAACTIRTIAPPCGRSIA